MQILPPNKISRSSPADGTPFLAKEGRLLSFSYCLESARYGSRHPSQTSWLILDRNWAPSPRAAS